MLPGTRYVVAINCCHELSDTCITDMLRRQHLECVDVVSYDSVAALPPQDYLRLLQQHVPHIFILHGEDLSRLPAFEN